MDRTIDWALKYATHYSTRTPDLQNMKPLTMEAAHELLEKFEREFPKVKSWREKFLKIDVAEVEKRLLANVENHDLDTATFRFLYGTRFQSAGQSFPMGTESFSNDGDGSGARSGRIQCDRPNMVENPKCAEPPTSTE